MKKLAFLAPLLLLLSVPASAETNLDRAAEICRAHMVNVGAAWRADSKYEPEYAAACAKVYSLWHQTDIQRNLEVIQRGIDDPTKKLQECRLCSDGILNVQ